MKQLTKFINVFGPQFLLVGLLVVGVGTANAGGLHRPVAVVSDSNGTVLVGNRDSGRIARIKYDREKGSASLSFSEQIAHRISDIALLSDNLLLVADSEANELLAVDVETDGFAVRSRISVDASPVRLAVSTDRQTVAVACLWARRVLFCQIGDSTLRGKGIFKARSAIDLEFSPREMLFVDRAELVVGDSFGSKLVGVQIGAVPTLLANATIPAHNIRGLAIEPRSGRLLVTHQLLNGFLPNSRDHVFWGNVLTNLMRFIELDQLRANGDSYARIHGAIYPLGEEKEGAGDPGRVVATSSGHVVSLLTGVNQVGIRPPGRREFWRIDVGVAPTAVCEVNKSPDGKTLVAVANKYGDSVSLIDLQQARVVQTVSLSGNVDLSLSERGEVLFHDASVSLDGWFSCHSCHPDGHSCDRLNDNLGDNAFGSPKRILSLLGVANTSPWAWNGSQTSIENQVRKSMDSTMRGTEQRTILESEVEAISAYLKTLPFPPGVDAARGVESSLAAKGRAIFKAQNCSECHAPGHYTTDGLRDAGLAGAQDLEFNPPTLRGVSQRQAWLHDGRATTLRSVFVDADHQQAGKLSSDDIDALIAFLRTL